MIAARRWAIPVLMVLVGVLTLLSIIIGRVTLTWDLWTAQDPLTRTILMELRLPRALLGVLVGAALGLGGAAMQGYLRNPLAEPATLGVSAMAALGAILSIFFNIAGLHPWVLPICGVLGGMAGMVALFVFAGAGASVLTLVLSGIILSALAVAGISLALSLSPSPWVAGEIVRWMLGSLTDRSFDELAIATPLIAAGAIAVLGCSRALDALTLGETGARSLGIDLNRTQWQLALGIGLMVGASTAVTGMIGFVGLIVPHLLRPLVGSRPGALLIPSAVGGAALVLAGDIVVRLLPGGSELQLAVIMSLIGAPFFFVLLHSMRRKLT
ncbi:MAG TPA: iron ABC transporter permease [Steroidobacter sp.]|uniref:FecCD family ABC transporter permease n=1 Tax=Steroidobacter sp. TaxID=1978227 RepID=UPI002EDA3771